LIERIFEEVTALDGGDHGSPRNFEKELLLAFSE
jgi:hypothetical protein